jgi:hypothetical protein
LPFGHRLHPARAANPVKDKDDPTPNDRQIENRRHNDPFVWS